MNGLLLNIVMALVWAAVTGDFSADNVALGFGIAFLILFFAQRMVGAPTYAAKVGKVINLTLFFLKELVIANVRVAYDVVTPEHQLRPGIIAIPLDARTETEITLLANLITLTPGTLALDVSSDRSELYVHAMYIDDPDQTRRQIKEGFERRVLEVLR